MDELGRRLPVFKPDLDLYIPAGIIKKDVDFLPFTIERLQTGWIVAPSAIYNNPAVEELVIDKHIQIDKAQSGQVLDLGDGVLMRFLEVRERAILLRLEYNQFSALFITGSESINKKMPSDIPISNTVIIATGHSLRPLPSIFIR